MFSKSLILCSMALVATQIVSCTEVPLQADFDITKYMGRWYEIYRQKNTPFQSGTDGTATYSLWSNNSVKVVNREWWPDEKIWSVANGIAEQIDGAQLTVSFAGGPPGDYRVLFTDYTGMAIIYSQSKLFGRPIEYGWILSRENSITEEQDAFAFDLYAKYTGLTKEDFHKTLHGVADPDITASTSMSPFYPTRKPQFKSEPPVPLQPSFDITQYLGKWYEIYRRKNTPFESGTDNTAEYSLYANDSVKVVNKEWLPDEDAWNTITGVAVPVSNARLAVSFGAGPPGDYRVLYTDYTDCAVVYSKASFKGIVVEYGWILARQPHLSQSKVDMAFDLYSKYTGLTEESFHKTVHGVANPRMLRRLPF